MHNTSRCAEIESRFPGLIKAIVNAHYIQCRQKTRAGGAVRRKVAGRGAKGG